MTITLNHTIVPARDKIAAARFFARIFGLKRGRTEHFAPVKVNKSLTLLFDDDDKFESHHLAFHVSKREFDAILHRIKIDKIAYGSAPWSLQRRQAQQLERRPRLFPRSERTRARADDRATVMPSFPGRRPRRKGAFGRRVKPNRSRVILTGQRCAIYDADIQWKQPG